MPTLNQPKKRNKRVYRVQKAAQFYNTTTWRKLREAHIMLHPICQKCCKNPAEEVHHITPILTGETDLEMQELAFDGNNLMSLCRDCHHKIHEELRHRK